MAAESKRFALARSALGPDPSHPAPALFAYGSLLLDEVIAALLGRVPENEQVKAPGYRVSKLPDQPYPGLVHDPSSDAHGRIYCELSPKEWAILDSFENPLYEVQVVMLEDGRRALAYVWTVDLLKGASEWTTDSMTGLVLENYLKWTRSWREAYDEQAEAS
ncbi:hypothetical protein KVR01_002435 [Diaporthe batatas]|uniref:uncharacterized protein n=1 Tax=Diaporthe batatas TaxID=748121 RepID=UPI001D04F3D4|nr:uncharacterized protein KVR01_002435 [Diaporthe batatas]KAG8166746.1 hypothetical protein KVR01_002435 [Diaporthe batatas]